MTREEAIKNIYALNAVCGQKEFYDKEFEEALSMAIEAIKTLEDFERAQIITGGRLNGRTYAYKCGLEDGRRKALEQGDSKNWYDVPSDEMTLEQARQAVKDLRKKLMEYLEKQEPCEDTVSKASVFEILGNLMAIPYDFDRQITPKDVSESMSEVRDLPSVEPVSCIATVKISKEDLQSTVNKKIADIIAIHTQGLDEEIRCTMCTNPMRSDKGCDGGCMVDKDMYEKVMDIIRNRIV